MRTSGVAVWLIAFFAAHLALAAGPAQNEQPLLNQYNLVPYPQKVTLQPGTVSITSAPEITLVPGAGAKEELGRDQLQAFFQRRHIPHAQGAPPVRIVLGSLEGEQDLSPWLLSQEITTLRGLHPQGYLLRLGSKQIVIMGRSEQGTLYGVQTLLQLLSQSGRGMRLPLLQIDDYPEVPNRYVDVTLAWYAHYPYIMNFGYGTQLWTEEQWRWFVDWCLNHKINGIDLCIYGYWPFSFPEYPETTLANIPVKTYDPKTGKTVTVRMTHPNIEREFLPALIHFAQERGIKVSAYIGLNTFDGGYAREHVEAQPYLPEQWTNFLKTDHSLTAMDHMLDLSNEAARQYLRSSLAKIMRMGFDGITFEMIEWQSSVCTKPACISKYWTGYENALPPNSVPKLTPLPVRIRADADILNDLYRVIKQESPHAEVGLIYHRIAEIYGWGPETLQAFKQFRAMIPQEVYLLQGPRAPRDAPIEGSEFAQWVNLANPLTYRHSDNIGGDAAAYDRLLYINNDPETRGDKPVPSLEWEIAQHRAAAKLHLQGASGYAFEWYGDEIYPLILAQYSWKPSGPDGVSDHEFLEYASQSMYGMRVGTLVAKALALSPPPMDHYPSPWVERAREAPDLAKQALDEYSGSEPEYRSSLEQIRTATLLKAGLYDVERLQKAAEAATGVERQKLLQQALTKAQQVGDLVLSGKPRINYLDCYGEGFFSRFEIFKTIQKLAAELGVEVGDQYRAN